MEFRSVHAVIFTCLLVLVRCAEGSANFAVNINKASGSFDILVDNAVWLSSGPVAFHVDGSWHSTSDKSLKLVAFSTASSNDKFGSYQLSVFNWTAGSTPVSTYFRVYANVEMIVFGQSFPAGAANTAVGNNVDVVSAFPTFQQRAPATPLNYLTYQGIFPQPAVGRFDSSAQIPGGAAGGGLPLVLHDASLRGVALSPFSNYMVAGQATSKSLSTLAFGILGLVQEIPAGYTHETVAVAGQGINSLMYNWGSTLLKQGGKSRSTFTSDVIIQNLGYWTDNGAYYYYNTEANTTYQQTVIDTKLWMDAQKYPVRNYQFDSWWYFKGNHSGVSLWEPRPDVFPDGFDYVQSKLQMPFALHNRYVANNSTYLPDYKFIVEDFCALPLDINWFLHIMNKSKSWGAVLYEQDWLITTYLNMQATQNNVDNSHVWLQAMNDAALQLGLTIQYCMPLPNHLLHSTSLQAVTQSRASDDYNPGNSQWQVGYSNMLLWSLGLVPFKDDFWTTNTQPGCKFASCVEPNPMLEAIVAALTAGPVGFSDAIGHTDMSTLMATCRADGVLLKADRPATPPDWLFAQQFNPSEQPRVIQLWTSDTTFGSMKFTYVLGAALPSNITLYPADLSLQEGTYVAFSFCTSALVYMDSTHGLLLPAAETHTPVDYGLYTIAPVFENGWAFLGENGKFISVSKQRITSLVADNVGIRVQFVATPGETVEFALMNKEHLMHTFMCSGPGTLVCTVATNQCECH